MTTSFAGNPLPVGQTLRRQPAVNANLDRPQRIKGRKAPLMAASPRRGWLSVCREAWYDPSWHGFCRASV